MGFLAVGFCRPGRPPFFDEFCTWIAAGMHGEMGWLARNPTLRETPENLLKGCRTVISLAYPYSSAKPLTSDGFSVARYTEFGQVDYHDRLKKLAKELARSIELLEPGSRSKVCVDSSPILEKSFAYRSGMGFFGKNNLLIIPGYGSYFYLAEILTTAFVEHSEMEPLNNQCGACTRCVDACPTGALEKPFRLDASRCLSYLTIEHTGTTSNRLGRKMGKCFFGCDVCQEVCPFNRTGASENISLPSTREILQMDEGRFKRIFGETPFARAGLQKLKSNIRALGAPLSHPPHPG